MISKIRDLCDPKLITIGSGLICLGYVICRMTASGSAIGMAVGKSYDNKNSILQYTIQHSTPQTSTQQQLSIETLKMRERRMLGAPEVTSANSIIIRAMRK